MAKKPVEGSDDMAQAQEQFREAKAAQRAQGTITRSDEGSYLKSGRQQKAEAKAAKKAARKAARGEPEPVTRREFLNYAWGAALTVVLAEAGIASFMYALPRFKEGEFGGVFDVGTVSSLPQVDSPPIQNLDGAFWFVNNPDGVRALYRVCTHLGCLYEWKDQTYRFECPCHGSKFSVNGKFIEGPAPRSLDQFAASLEQNGQVTATVTEGGAGLSVEGADPNAVILIDTGKKLLGPSH